MTIQNQQGTILLTGASGNIGREIQRHFQPGTTRLLLASREPLAENETYFDFVNLETSIKTLQQADCLFLLRPPQMADVTKYFVPLVNACKEAGIQHIVFLSVQGAESISFIPHAKIEKEILQSRIAYTFVRPGYFMHNLATAFKDDIKDRNRIEVPAGKAKFRWIDAGDIGRAVARILENPTQHANKAYTLTGNDLLDFYEVSELLSNLLQRTITYHSPSLLGYYRQQQKAGQLKGAIIATMLIHFLQRFQKVPQATNDLVELTGQQPLSLKEFIEKNKTIWQ